MSDDRTLGEVLHEARIKHNPDLERPRGVPPWPERAPWQRDLDEQMAAALAAEVRVRVAAEIKDRARKLWPPGFQREELDMAAVAVVKGGQGQERSDEKAPPS